MTPDLAANTRRVPLIGLRERREDAVERCEKNTSCICTKATHALLAFHFTEAGLAHYMSHELIPLGSFIYRVKGSVPSEFSGLFL